MIWILIGFELHVSNVGQVSPARLLIYGTLVHPRVSWRSRVDGVDMYDRKWCEQYLRGWFDKFRASSVPAGTVEIQTIDVDSFCRRLIDVIFVKACDIVMKHNAVQGPALMGSSYFLKFTVDEDKGRL